MEGSMEDALNRVRCLVIH